MNSISFNVTPEEAQTIVDALSSLPYRDVYTLIPKLIDQSNKAPEEPEE